MASFTLHYADERDKAGGIAGMAVTLVACDGEHLLAEINLDAPAGSNMVMTHDFGLPGNPRMSAKQLWTQAVKDLRAMTSMALGNIACRRSLRSESIFETDILDTLRALVRDEGADHCSLDADEADELFDSCKSYVQRLFAHPGICELAGRFRDRIMDCRVMSATETVEYLASLGLR